MSWNRGGLRKLGQTQTHIRLIGEMPLLSEDKRKHPWFWIMLPFLQDLRATETIPLKHVGFLLVILPCKLY